jgi:hypothetical protein
MQVYAAKGKQRMRSGGSTRVMQQMQQQMVSRSQHWSLSLMPAVLGPSRHGQAGLCWLKFFVCSSVV